MLAAVGSVSRLVFKDHEKSHLSIDRVDASSSDLYIIRDYAEVRTNLKLNVLT